MEGALTTSNKTNTDTDKDIPFCHQFIGKMVSVSGHSQYAKKLLVNLDSMEVGLTRFSSMGEKGPVQGLHWHVIKIAKDGHRVPPDKTPFFAISVSDLDE